jgi:hypothetical protein
MERSELCYPGVSLSAICRTCVDMICGLRVPLLYPLDKTLCPASPSLQWVRWATFPTFSTIHTAGLRYYAPLRLPLLRLGSLRISLDSRYLALSQLRSCPLRLALWVRKITPRRLASFIYRFACPGVLRKEMAVLSSSQTTPVCACPALRPRWCPLDLP